MRHHGSVSRGALGHKGRLVAPRRYGKTSLLGWVRGDADRLGWPAVYVDFFGVLTLSDVAARIERAYAEQMQGRLAVWFARVRRLWRPALRVGGAAAGWTRPDPGRPAEPPLLARLALPLEALRVAHHVPVQDVVHRDRPHRRRLRRAAGPVDYRPAPAGWHLEVRADGTPTNSLGRLGRGTRPGRWPAAEALPPYERVTGTARLS